MGLEVTPFLVKGDTSVGGLVMHKNRNQLVEIKCPIKAKTSQVTSAFLLKKLHFTLSAAEGVPGLINVILRPTFLPLPA